MGGTLPRLVGLGYIRNVADPEPRSKSVNSFFPRCLLQFLPKSSLTTLKIIQINPFLPRWLVVMVLITTESLEYI